MQVNLSQALLEQKLSNISNSSHFSMMREKIMLPQDNRHILSFKKAYDRLFQEFHEKLVQEYGMLRGSYCQEMEENFQRNLAEKQTNVDQAGEAILRK